MNRREVLTVPPADAGTRLDRWLASALSLSLDRARTLVRDGAVRIRGKRCAIERKLFGNETVEVERPEPRRHPATRPARGTARPDAPPPAPLPSLPVLFRDDHLLVVNKPAGLAVEPSTRGSPSVIGAAAPLGPFDVDGRDAPGLPHRLDADTTGALVLARSDRALAGMKRAFDGGEVEKEYLALVAGAPPDSGRLDTPYARDPRDPRRFTTRVPSPRRARLSFTVERRWAEAALLRVRLETGRTHQIRAQLADAGHPVLGDAIYGTPSPLVARQALHAERLAFPHPITGAPLEVRAPLPQDLAAALAALGRAR